MKKRLLFWGILALFVLTECQEEQKNVPNALGLKGNVKTLHSQTYDASVVFDNVMEERIWNEFYNFNRNGGLTEQRSYDIDNRLSSRSVHKYENGICVKETNFNQEGEVSGVNVNVYDGEGNKKEEVRHDENGNVSDLYSYEYDRNGRQSEYKHTRANGELVFRRVYEYNKSGNLVSETDYNEKNVEFSKKVSAYNADGQLVEVGHYHNGKLSYKVLFEYDDHGLLVSSLTIPYEDELLAEAKCVYEYDDHGNWVTETIFDVKKDQVRFITRREIVYYE